MTYDPETVRKAYNRGADLEDQAEKNPSLRTEIPREFIKKYLKSSDAVLDAGGGTGINAILMAQRCQAVTLVDISPKILELAAANIREEGLEEEVKLVEGDITDLQDFKDGDFSFVLCVGDAISYALDKGEQALRELVRVSQQGAVLIIGCDSKYGFMRLFLSQGDLKEVLSIHQTNETTCGMGPRTRLYTANEMKGIIESAGCEVLEIASTPTISDAVDRSPYVSDPEVWGQLKALELEICTTPDLLGSGHHLLFVARKS
jgi:ubiquinone/menaquinone biosynthesis C-methylase UbiE